MPKGSLIVIEGADGVGKTTQAKALAEYLRIQKKLPTILVREPGATRISNLVMKVLKNPDLYEMAVQTELMLYMASRAQLVHEIIIPYMEKGFMIVADRFLHSSVVYQGIAGGLGIKQVLQAGKIATQGVKASMTMIITLSDGEWSKRKEFGEHKGQDREEKKSLGFHQKVMAGYKKLLKDYHPAFKEIDGNPLPEGVFEIIRQHIDRFIHIHNPAQYKEHSCRNPVNSKVIECDGITDVLRCEYCGREFTARCTFDDDFA
jgi:dTMP kinase